MGVMEVLNLNSYLFFPKFHQSVIWGSEGYNTRGKDAHLETTIN